MRKFQYLLAYYTLITSIILFVWGIFFGPKPLGFIIAILVIPSSIYFWLLILGVSKLSPNSSAEEVKKQDTAMAKVALTILITLFVSTGSILVYSLITINLLGIKPTSTEDIRKLSKLGEEVQRLNQVDNQNEELVGELRDLKKQIDKIEDDKGSVAAKDPDFKTVQGVSDSTVGAVTINDDSYKNVNIYETKSSSSKVIGKAEFGKNYTFLSKDVDWYLVIFTAPDATSPESGKESYQGFISSRFVEELEI